MMSKKIWKSLLATPALLSATVAVSTVVGASAAVNAAEVSDATSQATTVERSASAAPLPKSPVIVADALATSAQTTAPVVPASQTADYGIGGSASTGMVGQVTSVSQLSDVKPTDWAFQALQSLVERYGCIVGYPDKTYRGNRALTRFEFAAGLNACMDRINELIAAGTADLVKKEDLLAVQKLQEEFAAELATLRGRVDALEARTATLEKQQFSTTTKLVGEVIFAIADTFGDSATRNGRNVRLTGVTAANEGRLRDDRTETIFADRVRLNFDTSFTGKDRLHTRLQAGNFTAFSGANYNSSPNTAFTGTNETRLGYDDGGGNAIGIDELNYRFPIGDNLRVQIDAVKNEFYDGYVSSLSPFTSSGLGANSRFGRFNSTLRSGAAGAGFTFDYKFGPALSLQGGYISDTDSNDPGQKNGLFNGAYSAIGQVVVRPAKALEVAVSYVRSYYPGGNVNVSASTGSAFASQPFGANPTSVDTFGAQVNFRLSPQFIVGGWFGYYKAYQGRSANEAEIYTGSVYLAFPDLLKKGNLGGIIVGIPAKVTGNDFRNAGVRRFDDDTTFHVEALYRYRLSDNIAITPGIIVIFNPEGNENNNTQYVGVLRTTFTF